MEELTIENLSKKFKDKVIVDDVNLTLRAGVTGLLGANGAGKTTLIRMIVDILTPSSGKILFNGENIQKLGENYREILGFLPQEFGFHQDFSVEDYLNYIGTLKGVSRMTLKKKIQELLEILTLSEVRRKKIRKLSGGMKRRVGIAWIGYT